MQNAIKRAEQLEIFMVFTRFEETLDGNMRQTTNKIMLLPYNVKKVVRKKVVETIRKVKSMLAEKTQRATTLPKQQPKKTKNNFKKTRLEHIPEWFSPVEYPTGETDRIYTDKDKEETSQKKELNAKAVSKNSTENESKEDTTSEETTSTQNQNEGNLESSETENASTPQQNESQNNTAEKESNKTTVASQNATSDEVNYITYENARFGFTVQYPDTFKSGPAPDNGDGLGFDNGEAEISAYGSYDVFKDNLQSSYEFSTSDAVGSIALQRRGDNWFVVSFVDANDNIVYQKSVLQGGVISTVRLTYPYNQKEKYDELVSHVVSTFVPSSGDR